MNRHDLEQFAARWADAVSQGKGFETLLGPSIDPAPFIERAAVVRARLGPLEVRVDAFVCDGDQIAWRWTLRASAGERVVRGVNFQRLDEGRVVEHWTMTDGA
jgi:hypothetical protein